MKLKMVNSLYVIADDKDNRCLGYLADFGHLGVFDAEYGRVDVPPDRVEGHNRLIDEATLKAVDETCGVGDSVALYVENGVVRTWMGKLVGRLKRRQRSVYVFERGGRVFAGELTRDSLTYFERIA